MLSIKRKKKEKKNKSDWWHWWWCTTRLMMTDFKTFLFFSLHLHFTIKWVKSLNGNDWSWCWWRCCCWVQQKKQLFAKVAALSFTNELQNCRTRTRGRRRRRMRKSESVNKRAHWLCKCVLWCWIVRESSAKWQSSPLRRRRAKRRPHRDTIDRCSSLSVCVCVHYCITGDHTAIESDHTSKLLPRQSGCFVVVWSGSLADCLRLCPSQWVLLCEWVCVCLALSSFSSTDSIDGRQLPLD